MTRRCVLEIAGAAALAAALAACHDNPRSLPEKPASEHPQASVKPPVDTGPVLSEVSTPLAVAAAVHVATSFLNVPRAPKAIVPSSHFDVNAWGNAVNTHTLLDANGKGAVPVSEARFLWGQEQLYVAFYAGDLDLEVRETKHDGAVWKDDSVTLSFFTGDAQKRLITVSPTGVLADGVCPRDAQNLSDARCDLHWESHARFAVDYDGTLNKLGDFDEEWTVELAIPLRSLDAPARAGTELSFAVNRCDMAFDGQRACGAWGKSEAPGRLVLQ